MARIVTWQIESLLVLALFAGHAGAAEQDVTGTRTISGIVMELRSGTPDVPVCLCDEASGLPVAKDTYLPMDWEQPGAGKPSDRMAIVLSDQKGVFRFENVPDGTYRLIAQRWIGPYKGVFEEHGTVIQMLGVADHVVVPRPDDPQQSLVVLRPPGNGIVQFDQEVGNSSTLMFLSTSPPEFDPILGLHALGPSFRQHLIGINRMPLGKTTVLGVPGTTLYAFFFAPDNSPGFAAVEVPASPTGFVRVSKERFVAGWSDGRKTPPPQLAELTTLLDRNSLTVRELLEIPELSNATYKAYRDRMRELMLQLSRNVELPNGKSARVGDLLAVEQYRRLQE